LISPVARSAVRKPQESALLVIEIVAPSVDSAVLIRLFSSGAKPPCSPMNAMRPPPARKLAIVVSSAGV
jgi:hypothetical protein